MRNYPLGQFHNRCSAVFCDPGDSDAPYLVCQKDAGHDGLHLHDSHSIVYWSLNKSVYRSTCAACGVALRS